MPVTLMPGQDRQANTQAALLGSKAVRKSPTRSSLNPTFTDIKPSQPANAPVPVVLTPGPKAKTKRSHRLLAAAAIVALLILAISIYLRLAYQL